MIPSGIEPATFQIVAQYLNHCATTVLFYLYLEKSNSEHMPLLVRQSCYIHIAGLKCFLLWCINQFSSSSTQLHFHLAEILNVLPIGHTTLVHDEDKLTINNAAGATVLHRLLPVVWHTANSILSLLTSADCHVATPGKAKEWPLLLMHMFISAVHASG
jgi:hypothetical protein